MVRMCILGLLVALSGPVLARDGCLWSGVKQDWECFSDAVTAACRGKGLGCHRAEARIEDEIIEYIARNARDANAGIYWYTSCAVRFGSQGMRRVRHCVLTEGAQYR